MQQIFFLGFMTIIYIVTRIFSRIKGKREKNWKEEIGFFVFWEFIFGLIGVTLLPIYIRIGYQPTWSDIDININLIPFHFIKEFFGLIKEDAFYIQVAIKNVIGNLILFMPLGFLIPMRTKRPMKVSRVLLICLCSSLTIEIMQTVERFLGIGLRIADIDDIILNCIGGGIGFVIYKIYKRR